MSELSTVLSLADGLTPYDTLLEGLHMICSKVKTGKIFCKPGQKRFEETEMLFAGNNFLFSFNLPMGL